MEDFKLTNPYLDPVTIFTGIFIISALGGIAALLRSSRKIDVRGFVSSTLNGGLVGVIISFLFWYKFKDEPIFLIGLAALAGFGGSKTISFLFTYFERKFLPKDFHERKDEENT